MDINNRYWFTKTEWDLGYLLTQSPNFSGKEPAGQNKGRERLQLPFLFTSLSLVPLAGRIGLLYVALLSRILDRDMLI